MTGMIRGFIAMIVAPAALLVTTQAQAELTLCNRTSFRMEAAVGIEKRANVMTRGWYRLDPGQCRQVMDGPLDADMVYLHARTRSVYGAAPLPQNGDADFCIRNGDFEITNARDCASSQQAHFGAAKPSDSPKGPVVNLAEEADYDDAQARVAGVERLPADRIEAALQGPAVDVPERLHALGEGEETMAGVEGRIDHGLRHTVVDDGVETIAGERLVDARCKLRRRLAAEVEDRDHGMIFRSFTNSVV